MDAGETMVDVIRPTTNLTTASGDSHEGIKQYYIQKIEELQVFKKEINPRKIFINVFLVKCSRKKSKFTSSSSETK